MARLGCSPIADVDPIASQRRNGRDTGRYVLYMFRLCVRALYATGRSASGNMSQVSLFLVFIISGTLAFHVARESEICFSCLDYAVDGRPRREGIPDGEPADRCERTACIARQRQGQDAQLQGQRRIQARIQGVCSLSGAQHDRSSEGRFRADQEEVAKGMMPSSFFAVASLVGGRA